MRKNSLQQRRLLGVRAFEEIRNSHGNDTGSRFAKAESYGRFSKI